jgi:hypothetical protein
MKIIPLPYVAVGFLFLLLLVGCSGSPQRTHLQGKVTYHSQPVGDQTLVLYSSRVQKEFSTHKIPIGADGTFAGEGPAPGEYFVVIEESLAAQESRRASGKAMKIPPKYRGVGTTDLTWSLHAGENKRDIELSD